MMARRERGDAENIQLFLAESAETQRYSIFLPRMTLICANGLIPHAMQMNANSNPPSPAVKTDSGACTEKAWEWLAESAEKQRESQLNLTEGAEAQRGLP